MSVRCSHCGEELLGAVNRCWKCGHAFAAQPTTDGLPPVRRVPLTQEPLAATVAESGGVATSEAPPNESSDAPIRAELATAEPNAENARPLRTGSPFSPLATPAPVTAAPLPLTQLPASSYRRKVPQRPNIVAVGGAVGSISLGLFALVLSPFRAEAAIVALIGMAMGIWGLYSPRRAWALVGLLICCLAIGLASYTGAKALNAMLNRNKAWDPDTVDIENMEE
jgi:hypothetical protein